MKIKNINLLLCWLFLTFVFIAILGFLDLIFLNPVSPWHDELWNIYPALNFFGVENTIWHGCKEGMCITFLGHQIPILSGYYHGILKTILFSPLALLGNIELVRLSNILIYLIPIIFIWKDRKIYGEMGVWILIFSYYVLFPNFLFEIVFDQGQIVIPNTLLAIAVLELAKNYKTFSPNSLVFAIFLASLAVYEKLTNLPVSLAIIGTAGLLLLCSKSYKQFLFAATSVILISPYLIFFSRGGFSRMAEMTSSSEASYLANLESFVIAAYDAIFVRSFTLSSIMDGNVSNQMPSFILIALIAIWIGAVALSAFSNKNQSLRALLVLSIPIQVFLLFPFFDGLNRPWHTYQLVPLVLVPIGFFAYAQMKDKNVFAIVFIILTFLFGMLNLISVEKGFLNKPRKYPYDISLFEVSKAIKRNPFANNIVCLDYSVCYNLVFLLGSDFKILADWSFAPTSNVCGNIEAIKDQNFYLITKMVPDAINNDHDAFLYGRSLEFQVNCINLLKDQTYLLGLNQTSGYQVYSSKEIGN